MGLLSSGVALACLPAAFLGVVEKRPPKVGEIVVIGNEVTKDRVIREVLDLLPGQVLREGDLREAESRLRKLGLFATDPKTGAGPRVFLDPNGGVDGEFKTVFVMVKEKATWGISLRPAVTAGGFPAIGVTLEERNFDPLRLPTCPSDLSEGRAWRGGGQTARLTLLRVPIWPMPMPLAATLTGLAPDGVSLRGHR